MSSHFGKIEIGKIKNKQQPNKSKSAKELSFIEMNESHVKFVHYPDCQQLIIWLPHPGREYGKAELINERTGKLKEEWEVNDRLNGSVQLSWDTLDWSTGSYILRISWKEGWQHIIELVKHKEGWEEKSKTVQPEKKKNKKEAAPKIYRDGFGKDITNEDLILREKLNKELARKFSRRVDYEGNLRAGTIIYTAGEIRIEFPHEMGGGNCMFYFDIPVEKDWEQRTKTPLSSRKEILEFVAQTVQAQQASNCYYEIKSDTVGFYYQ